MAAGEGSAMQADTRARARPSLGWPIAALIGVVFAFYAPFLGGEVGLLPVHTAQLSPWRSAASPAELQRLDRDALPTAADKTLMFHPQLRVATERARSGELAHWNPSSMAGVPLLAQAVHGLFHWPNALGLILPLPQAYGWIAALQALLAAVFAAALARELRADRLGAFAAGVIFAFSGYLAARQHWYQIQGASMYLPLALLCVERLFRGGRWGAVAVLGLAVGCSFLAGFPQGTLHLVYAAAIWGGARWIYALRQGGPAAARGRRTLLPLVVGLGLGVGLGLPQMLPAFALADGGASTRAAVDPATVRSLGMGPGSLVNLVAPELLGHPRDLAAHELPHLRQSGSLRLALEKPGTNHVETSATLGLGGLLLAFLGLGWRRGGRGPAVTLTLAGLLLAFDSPLCEFIALLPGLDTGDPRRFLLLFDLGGALLAGLGLTQLMREGPRLGFRILVYGLATALILLTAAATQIEADDWAAFVARPLAETFGVSTGDILTQADDLALDVDLLLRGLLQLSTLAAVCAAGVFLCLRKATRRLGGALLVLATGVELLLLVAAPNATGLPVEGFDDPPPGLERLLAHTRIVRFDPGSGGVVRDPLAYPLPPNTGVPFGVPDLSGYITLAPLRLELLHEVVQPGTGFGVGLAALSDPDALAGPLLDIMGVSGVLSTVELDRSDLVSEGRIGAAWLYRRASALPRVFVTRRVRDGGRLAGPGGVALPALVAGTAEPLDWCWIEGDVRETDPAQAARWPAPTDGSPAVLDGGSALLQRDEPEHLEIDVSASDDGWLVVLDSWMPGWTATVDGEPAELAPAYVAFRAVPVPAGDHVVRMEYVTPGWKTGRALGLASLLLLVACGLVGLRGRARARRFVGIDRG